MILSLSSIFKCRRPIIFFVFIAIIGFSWITFAWSMERWGGTICLAQRPHYISRDQILMVGVNQYIGMKSSRLDRSYSEIYDWNATRKFILSHEGCCYIKRNIAIKMPSTYWIAIFFPFDRSVIAAKDYDESHDVGFFDERDSGQFFKSCWLSSILKNHPF